MAANPLPPPPSLLRNPQLAALLCRNGMSFEIIDGQRLYGPPNNHVGPHPPRGCEVFVRGIPKTAFEPELVPIFERIGPIYEMRIPIKFIRFNRGYCFVQYFSPDDADRAVLILDKYEIRPGHFLGVTNSVENNRLYVGGFPRNLNRMEFLEEMQRVTSDVVRVYMSYDVQGRTNNRGFAFVEYTNHRAASLARSKFRNNKIRIFGEMVRVDWALPESHTRRVYVKNLPPTISGKFLEDLFNANSNNGVTRVNKSETSAHISFVSEECARQAQKKLNNCKMDGYQVKVIKEKHGPWCPTCNEQNRPTGSPESDIGNPVGFENASGLSAAGEAQEHHQVEQQPTPPWPFLMPAFQHLLGPSPSLPPSPPTQPPVYFPQTMPTPTPNLMGPVSQCSCHLPIPRPAYLNPTYPIARPSGLSGVPMPIPMQIHQQFPIPMPVGQFNPPHGYLGNQYCPEVIQEEWKE